MNREISYTPEFEEFYQALDSRTKKKLAHVVDLLTGFIKKATKDYDKQIEKANKNHIAEYRKSYLVRGRGYWHT